MSVRRKKLRGFLYAVKVVAVIKDVAAMKKIDAGNVVDVGNVVAAGGRGPLGRPRAPRGAKFNPLSKRATPREIG